MPLVPQTNLEIKRGGEKREEIIIIGAGIVGLTAGLYLQRAGLNVTLLDKDGIAAGASYGNAGHFATEQVFPLADPHLLYQLPGMLLDPLGPFRIRPQYFHRALPWFMRFLVNMLPSRIKHNSQAIKALNHQAIAEMKEVVNFCQCEELLVLNGSLLVFESSSLAVVQQQWQHYLDAGVKVELLTGEQVRQLEPSLSKAICYGLFFTQVGHTPDPSALCHAIADKFMMLGGTIERAEVISINQGTGQEDDNSDLSSAWLSQNARFTSNTVHLRIKAEAQSQSSVKTAGKVLLSAGAWSKPLAAQLGHSVPLETERGYHLMMPQLSMLSRPVASFERKFIITPMAQGTRLAGTVEFGGLTAPMAPARAECLFPHGKALLPQVFAKASVSDGLQWMGFRPSLPDSLPVLGNTQMANVFVSFGHQHLGLTWSAVTAKLVGQTILGNTTDIDITPYRITRFD